MNHYNGSGILESKTIYKDDDKNYLIEAAEYNTDGSLKSKSSFTNDNKGHQIEQLFL